MENGECPFLHNIQLTLGENKEVELEQLLGSELFIQKEEETKKNHCNTDLEENRSFGKKYLELK